MAVSFKSTDSQAWPLKDSTSVSLRQGQEILGFSEFSDSDLKPGLGVTALGYLVSFL